MGSAAAQEEKMRSGPEHVTRITRDGLSGGPGREDEKWAGARHPVRPAPTIAAAVTDWQSAVVSLSRLRNPHKRNYKYKKSLGFE
ncbi:hypothetical protein NL676_033024 [Syzygium grande]|nr:hypothetical protein NL676_033024 [Syzygium grande]